MTDLDVLINLYNLPAEAEAAPRAHRRHLRARGDGTAHDLLGKLRLGPQGSLFAHPYAGKIELYECGRLQGECGDDDQEPAGSLSLPGEIRCVLDGESVQYGSAPEIMATLEYDLQMEREYRYPLGDMDSVIGHLAHFVARLWQIHAFGEGNTRTTAVFFIKYLRTLGFDVTNDIFAENAWYFRNALVRANYNNYISGIRETTEYLERFLRNLLLGERNELRNRDMHISGVLGKQDIEPEKQDIQTQKQDIGMPDGVKPKTKAHIGKLFAAFGHDKIFGRTDVMRLLGLTASPASELLRKMHQLGLTEAVTGSGKGKYVFRKR